MASSVKKNKQATPQYTRAELMNHAEALFAVKAEVLYGALYEAAQETFSIEEAKERINQFMKAKVKG
ncbi:MULTISPECIES: hypothetical protein [Paenibacillus]|uniref:YqzN/YkzM domain-containing protein n=1 Tax=Paenibacillus pabuli TaxID=1472 RepID=A0A855YEL4_9BACL|nr:MULTISPECIES: hypothetical protein [Paenibacillus]PWW45177.1 hypothetical protein DET56_101377 [Paenibacillus pabuli]PXW11514.1 hypothetical protein DEU73_101377 [Paenibacillus taichungensis]RAI92403.1 hypothetical protein DET54_110111 [Paenibacillus pabuli]